MMERGREVEKPHREKVKPGVTKPRAKKLEESPAPVLAFLGLFQHSLGSRGLGTVTAKSCAVSPPRQPVTS